MQKLKDVINSKEKPEIKIVNDDLKKYIKYNNINVKRGLDLNKLHKIWHYGVVANIELEEYIIVFETRGERLIKLTNNYSGNNEICLKVMNNDSRFNSFLDTIIKSDDYFIGLKDREIEANEDVFIINQNVWVINVYNKLGRIVNSITLKSELFTEALADAESYFTKLYNYNIFTGRYIVKAI